MRRMVLQARREMFAIASRDHMMLEKTTANATHDADILSILFIEWISQVSFAFWCEIQLQDSPTIRLLNQFTQSPLQVPLDLLT